ncbi:glycoside hydrolase family 5 protein [Hypoxylon trugodes]|uniref:glycoside hydrolase family 5 protein n=1 Tax=Hypoxylon trugodes TaxID=326681 RepID=UPI002190CE1E|nr:glycoside hydrolase family 5 protein [Hypoxylon trugodes]KAI1384400.1 glycoside hydrolase family 5 protein [Hypoxylon trugodes]
MHFKTFFLVAAARVVLARVQFLGVAIAGGDFGCQIDGSCSTGSTQLPLNNDGIAQMQHFVKDDSINILRLPISWQFLVNNKLGSNLDSGNLARYDQLVQACLATGAHCMIDVHNFARWNGGIIGQGGPTDDQFVSLWKQLASKYAKNQNIVFELMNEPHDLDVGVWASTCQKVVTAIREAGATSHMILLPGTNFDSAATLADSGGADQLLDIKNPDGTTDDLILDIHKYLDEDNSGTHSKCTTDNTDAFTTIAQFLREKGRKGFISETGASQDASCLGSFCAQNALINKNSDVFVGLVGWGAGSFDTSYVMSMTPSKQNGRLVDNQLMSQCLIATWVNSKDTGAAGPEPSTPPSSSTLPANPTSATTLAQTSVPVVTVKIDPETTTLHTTSIPSSLTTLIVAAGTPGSQSYSIDLARPTTTKSQPQTQSQTPIQSPTATTATGGSSSTRVSTILLGCALISLLLR